MFDNVSTSCIKRLNGLILTQRANDPHGPYDVLDMTQKSNLRSIYLVTKAFFSDAMH